MQKNQIKVTENFTHFFDRVGLYPVSKTGRPMMKSVGLMLEKRGIVVRWLQKTRLE